MPVILEYNKDLLWSSDWNGYEVGFDDVEVVGLYILADTNASFYIDIENNKILEVFVDEEE